MAVIVYKAPTSADDVWRVARWAFVWILRQAMSTCSDEPMRVAMERAIALDGLHIHLLDSSIAERIRLALLSTASLGAAGNLQPVEVNGHPLDETSQAQFREAAAELVKLLMVGDAHPSPKDREQL